VGAIATRLCERASVFARLVCAQIAHIGEPLFDKLHGEAIELLEIRRRIPHLARPVKAEPIDILFNRIDKLLALFRRVRVIETQITLPPVLGGNAEVKADRFRMADMQIAVRLWWKASLDAAGVAIRRKVFGDNVPNKVSARCAFFTRRDFVLRWFVRICHSVSLPGATRTLQRA